MTDEEILDEHAAASRIVAEAVAGLVDRFGHRGVSPLAVMEGSLKASVMLLATRNGMVPDEIADLIDEVAGKVRAMPDNAFAETAH
ncbi:MAG: hypothetical protein CMJ42_13455 [Phyllobacteriaceae bacterium]|nr:hypothetical protein [Phyllobacteriaceae bacterium]